MEDHFTGELTLTKCAANSEEKFEHNIPLIAVVGPTGVGKTEVGIFLAENLDGEIINFDSVQVYQLLNIGAAKPSPEELARVPHHLLGFLPLDKEFNAAQFVELADQAIKKLHREKKLPILVGGTGLYLKALLHGLFEVGDTSQARKELKARLKKEGLSSLYEELKRIDPAYARKISPKDWVRILRALEVYYTTGKPFSELAREHAFARRRYPCLKIGLTLPREELYRRLDQRADKMLAAGLLDEVRKILAMGYSPELKPLKSIGYRHMIAYLKGKLSFEEAVRLMKRDTRRYAKRQLTWFKRDHGVKWFHPNEKEKILVTAKKFLDSYRF
ncbi:tRNA (adenosine(37)-N6)-dimethylallyltransferase MiaA [Thermodesulfatator autotrophicus]|uniref:tRNA dimethylallyltransferase n=1 Tax=Thermodesulfatator autotrophicus TaxID=1795632 RepID=A0A177E8K6_9BACT|nr:tRNA (adenosine(37)-N6)-dimethylallyltransferase MiaA [Thermodesulfatator autotrophicus]OAG27750.1 tRNA dimethylallyltransferase [Thermodesulfatator autotrophicus]